MGTDEYGPAGAALRLLFFEDCPADVELAIHALRGGGLDFRADVAANKEQLLTQVRSAPYDAILADYSMPQFTGMAAFELLKAEGFDIPFILVSGALGEERA